MMENELTYRQVVEDTVKYYSEDTRRRSLEGSICTYYNPENGNMCAVGRYMCEPQKFTIDNIGEMDFSSLLGDFNFEDIMKEEVKNLNNILFWEKLQCLHDWSTNWTKYGLKDSGKSKYEELLEFADRLDGQN
jgi:hypothetical protein